MLFIVMHEFTLSPITTGSLAASDGWLGVVTETIQVLLTMII